MASSRLWRVCVTALTLVVTVTSQQTGFNPDWPRWCGKVYEAGYPNFDPGGQTPSPIPNPSAPLLNVQFKPRYSLYLSTETHAEIIVTAPLTTHLGTPWPPTNSTSSRANHLIFSIHLVNSSYPLIQATIPINTTSTFSFPLSLLPSPSLNPVPLVLYGAPEAGTPTYTAISSILYLPDKPSGSTTRIDNLKGGLYFRNSATNHTFEPFLPYGFYASDDNFLRVTNGDISDAKRDIKRYADLGLNAMIPLTTTGYKGKAGEVLDYLTEVGIKWMYNLRENYKNLSYVEENVKWAREQEGVWGYWSVDEPDGWQDPFELVVGVKGLINRLDPYHVVSVTLNCQNYYFKEYSAGGDIIMTDPYPIGINATYSKWGTPCNTTYGDCGCDNCLGVVQDVPDRLDTFNKYESWLGLWPKTKIHNPQSFHGQDYWLRDPSPEEEDVMNVLGVMHGSRGVISWLWPASDVLGKTHGELAKVLTRQPALGFLVGGDGPERIEVGVVKGIEVVDAAYWVDGDGQKMLVSVVNGGYVDVNGTVEVPVANATGIERTVLGDVEWKLEGGKLVVNDGLPALATSMVILTLKG
ncbi:hypothetical protein QBC44DRAFT_248480 [Cladorrhinum sp. PSN332]|nr:hypothetical protein QBC44DRAFT_248480 [Cladorrhinum sp. PSN332]